jgi:DNA polymerase-3 subunit gamma/tau
VAAVAGGARDIPDWKQLVDRLGLTALAKQLAVHCIVKRFSNDMLELLLDPKHSQVRTSNTEDRLRAALEKHFGISLRLKIELGEQTTFTPAQEQAQHQVQRHQGAVELIEQDPNVKAMQETFNARITPDSIIATD